MNANTWIAVSTMIILVALCLLAAWGLEGYAFRRVQQRANDEQVARVYGPSKDKPYNWRSQGL